jgi:hypothetical protein
MSAKNAIGNLLAGKTREKWDLKSVTENLKKIKINNFNA